MKPKVTVCIVFDMSQAPLPDLAPRLFYYCEALWDEMREEPRISLSFQDIDTVRDRLSFTATSFAIAKRAVKTAEMLLSAHRLLGRVTIEPQGSD